MNRLYGVETAFSSADRAWRITTYVPHRVRFSALRPRSGYGCKQDWANAALCAIVFNVPGLLIQDRRKPGTTPGSWEWIKACAVIS
jgi:hypothetical protein